MNLRLKATVLMVGMLTLTLFPFSAHCQPPKPDYAEWLKQEIKKHCNDYDVEPEFAAAVMKMESNFKCGPLGKSGRYYGPGGLYKGFLKTWRIDIPEENIRVTVMSLQNTKSEAAKIKRLKRYNKEFWKNNYIPDVLKTYRQYKRKKTFEVINEVCYK